MVQKIDPNLARAKATTSRQRYLAVELPSVVVCAFLIGLFLARTAHGAWIPVLVLGLPVLVGVSYLIFFRWSVKRTADQHWDAEVLLDAQRRTETLAKIEAARKAGKI